MCLDREAASAWGLQCMRYEIRDITAPAGVRAAMELQAEAERRKRAQILDSEGQRQAKINVSEGEKAQVILASEAAQQDAINRATGAALQYPVCRLGNCAGAAVC